MSTVLILIQLLNGLQLGVILFLIAAGLTLVFGVMGFINLAHGVQYMLGAYLAVFFYGLTGSFMLALLLSIPAALVLGLILEFLVFRHLYDRDHLSQVLATFGVILFLNQLMKVIFGPSSLSVPPPEFLDFSFTLVDGLLYPAYRVALIVAGLLVALVLFIRPEGLFAPKLTR
jgi:branched-chain amino acid transport system permease protein